MIAFMIDEVVCCLKEVTTGIIFETQIVKLRKKELSKYNKRTGWYINWSKFSKITDVYALVLKGTKDVQGMIAVQYDDVSKAVYLLWGCVAPHNNIYQYGKKRFSGVGGHLIALASELSVKKGYDGYVYGEAMDKYIYEYYCKEFGAIYLPPANNPYRFMIPGEVTASLREVYTYEWTDEFI